LTRVNWDSRDGVSVTACEPEGKEKWETPPPPPAEGEVSDALMAQSSATGLEWSRVCERADRGG